MSSQITSSNPVVKAVIEGSAPRPAQVAASRGLLPLPQTDLLEILVNFFEGSDPELKKNAAASLASQEAASLEETIRSTEIAPAVLSYFAGRSDVPAKLHESIVLNPLTPAGRGCEICGFDTKRTSSRAYII